MNWTREQLKSNAKLMVKKNYWLCVIVTFIVGMLAGSGSINIDTDSDSSFAQQIASNLGGDWSGYVMKVLPALAGAAAILVIFSLLLQILVGNPLQVGEKRFYLHNIHSNGELGDLGFAFKNQWLNVVKVMFVTNLVIYVGFILLLIPGIIFSYQYYLVPYLLADNPELSISEAMGTSKAMMEGEKMNAFILGLSFIGWQFLSAITLGIVGIFWVNPYFDATFAEMYMAIKARYTGTSF